jgi:hypothetical protein
MNKSAQILLYRIILGCPLLLVAPEHALAAPSDPDWKESDTRFRHPSRLSGCGLFGVRR